MTMESLGLDIKLLLAQIINFGIMFFILSKFVFKPISKLIEERKKKIEEASVNSQKIEDRLLKLEEKEKSVLKKAEDLGLKKREEMFDLAEKQKEEMLNEARLLAEKEFQKATERIRAQEVEVYEAVKGKIMSEMVPEVVKKLSEKSKRDKYPVLKNILK